MFAFKITDVVLQGTALLAGLTLWINYGAYGYFYWISLGIIAWNLVSIILNFLFFKSRSVIRLIISLIYILFAVLFGVAFLLGISVSELNYHYQTFSLIFIIGYFFLCLLELNNGKNKTEIDLDF